jgi:glutamyl-tRNA synthetase
MIIVRGVNGYEVVTTTQKYSITLPLMTEIRTRFAPSPTGFQHIGGFRTAFYAWLLAKHFGGKFLLRIEDTDRERLVPGAVRYIIEELAWFGITIDEGPSHADLAAAGELWDGAPELGGGCGPYIQSLRLPRYQEVAERLVAEGHAYRCDCTTEMLERERLEQMARKEAPGYSGYCRNRNVPKETKHTVRFKMPTKRSVSFVDAIRGRVTWDSIPLRDSVVLKSDGFPTYHLAVVVDDHDMKITHALRGIEWLSSTPLHLLLYEALGWEPVTFAHLPVINGPDGKKLSKRHGAPKSTELREQGYLPEALMNFVSLIGWSPGEGSEQEVFSRDELVKTFALPQITQSSGVFDPTKLLWMNGVYIRNLPVADFIARAQPFLEAAGVEVPTEAFAALAPHVQERVKVLTEVPAMIEFLSNKPLQRSMEAMFHKGVDAAKARQIVTEAIEKISALPEFTVQALDQALRALAEEVGLKAGPTFVVLRVAVTGKTITPPLFESFAVLGRDAVVSRLRETLALLPA